MQNDEKIYVNAYYGEAGKRGKYLYQVKGFTTDFDTGEQIVHFKDSKFIPYSLPESKFRELFVFKSSGG